MGKKPGPGNRGEDLRKTYEEVGEGRGKHLCETISERLNEIEGIDNSFGRISEIKGEDKKNKKESRYIALINFRTSNQELERLEQLKHHVLSLPPKTSYLGKANYDVSKAGPDWYTITIIGKPGNAHHRTEHIIADLEKLLAQVESFK